MVCYSNPFLVVCVGEGSRGVGWYEILNTVAVRDRPQGENVGVNSVITIRNKDNKEDNEKTVMMVNKSILMIVIIVIIMIIITKVIMKIIMII